MHIQILEQFASSHPLYYGVLSFGAGYAFPKAVKWLVTDGAILFVKKGFAFQRTKLKLLGAKPEEIKEIEEREAEFFSNLAKEAQAEADAEPIGPEGTK